MNSFIDQTIGSGVGTGAATAAKLAENFHLLREQIEAHLLQSHEALHTFALDKWGINIDLSSFCIILFTTFTILVTLPFIKVFAFSSKKNNKKGQDISIETTDKEGYEESIPSESEMEATKPFEIEIEEPKQEKESPTPTESSNFEVTQVIETELLSIDFADEEIPSAIEVAEQKEDDEEEEHSDEEISANSSDDVLLPEVNVVISESDIPSSPIISKKLLRQPLETSQSQTLSPRVSSRVRSQPERFSPRGKLLPTENVMGRSRKLNNNII